MKCNKKCVFNVNFQYNHKQVPTAYFSMMFNIHKHISHLIFVLVPECEVYFSIVTYEIPLRVRKKTHVGLNAQSGRQ
jgi:hypothetical protein